MTPQLRHGHGFIIAITTCLMVYLSAFAVFAATGVQSSPPACLFVGARTVTIVFVAPARLEKICASLGARVSRPLVIRDCYVDGILFLQRPGRHGVEPRLARRFLWHGLGHAFGDGTTPIQHGWPVAIWDNDHQSAKDIAGCRS